MTQDKSPFGQALKAALNRRQKLAVARKAAWRRKDKARQKEDRKDPVYREAYNEAQRRYRLEKKEVA